MVATKTNLVAKKDFKEEHFVSLNMMHGSTADHDGPTLKSFEKPSNAIFVVGGQS